MGISALNENPIEINTTFLKKFEAFQIWQDESQVSVEEKPKDRAISETNTPEEIIGQNFKKIHDSLSQDLLDVILQKTPAQFEKFVLELLNKMGYGITNEKNFEIVGKSGDNGIDGIIYQDKLGIDRIYVQAKQWKENKVRANEIRDFIGSLSLRGTNKGVFMTASEFTEDAIRTIQLNPQNIIILIDGKKLTDYAITFNVGVQVKETYQVKTVNFDFFRRTVTRYLKCFCLQ